MHLTGIESHYALKDGKRLRYGYTTGTCAAAAAKAAAQMLLTGQPVETVELLTPKGIALNLEVLEPRLGLDEASCAVRKSSGDDPDVTDGMLVFARVSYSRVPGVQVDGGAGVGRVTKPGLRQPVGAAAINPVPRQMIAQAVEQVLADSGQAAGAQVVISIPGGAEMAQKTFNPRLGIVGGLSILGTSGIVEPMSEAALIESIGLEIRQKRALGATRLLVAPGNYGAAFLRGRCRAAEQDLVKCSNYVGVAIDLAAEAGFSQLLFVSHIGKFIKVSGGIMNTHSKEADCRAELMAACALRAGCSGDTARDILSCLTTDAMLEVLRQAGCLEETMEEVGRQVAYHLDRRGKGRLTVGAVIFSDDILCTTGPAARWLKELEASG